MMMNKEFFFLRPPPFFCFVNVQNKAEILLHFLSSHIPLLNASPVVVVAVCTCNDGAPGD